MNTEQLVPERRLISVEEAAALWGITKQRVAKQFKTNRTYVSQLAKLRDERRRPVRHRRLAHGGRHAGQPRRPGLDTSGRNDVALGKTCNRSVTGFPSGARRQHPGDDGNAIAADDGIGDDVVFGKGEDVVAHGLIAATPGDTIDLRTGDIKPNNPADLVHMGRGGFLSEKRAQEKPVASFRVYNRVLKFRRI